MALTFRISYAAAAAMLDVLGSTTFDAGTAAVINIYTGAQPADVETAASGTLLAELTMSADSFGPAANQNPGARITAAAITQDSSANATGTAGYFRCFIQSGGDAICDGSVGTSGTDMVVNTTSFTSGATVSCSAFTITLAEAA